MVIGNLAVGGESKTQHSKLKRAHCVAPFLGDPIIISGFGLIAELVDKPIDICIYIYDKTNSLT